MISQDTVLACWEQLARLGLCPLGLVLFAPNCFLTITYLWGRAALTVSDALPFHKTQYPTLVPPQLTRSCNLQAR